ncbi:flavodoxin family protein [Candidatus Bathyarchaeota archaeon]|nr:flavodoxin family protein [Candidatus Bathyarchaeota archaeon]
MKVVGVVGSARPGGNTEILTNIALDEIQKEGIETELISLAGKKIEPCDGCRACSETGKCHYKDDFEKIAEKMIKADGIILSSPVYYGAASPQIVSLISRFFSKRDKPLRNKVGGPIVVARRAGKNFTFAQLLFFFMIQEMIIPGSSYWNVAFGRSKGEVLKDEEGINTIKTFGKKIAWLLKKLKTNESTDR